MVHNGTGTVVTIAGGAAKGIADGVGPAARFNALLSIEFDATGTIAYVCDGGNHAIRQITLNNNSVTTLAGVKGVYGVDDGPASTATFRKPYGITRLGERVPAGVGQWQRCHSHHHPRASVDGGWLEGRVWPRGRRVHQRALLLSCRDGHAG